MDIAEVQQRVAAIAQGFASQRRERQIRTNLDRADFDALAEAGYLLVGVPESMGGLWRDVPSVVRPYCELLRTIAHGDPSVALVSAMHPAVTSYWLALDDPSIEEQRRFVAQSALDGAWWGTVTSEPGSGGDVMRSRAIARRRGDGYALSGQKHFGSGSGITSYMITSAVPEGEQGVTLFFLDVRDAKWDGSTGMKLIAAWDGHGMTATQSHAFEFTDYPVTRIVQPPGVAGLGPAAVLGVPLFSAVIVGTVQSVVAAARAQLGRRHADLRPYEQVEWARIENDAWLIDQAYEGVLRAVEARGTDALLETLHGKTSIAELAESVTQRLCRVVGGGSFSRSSHYGAAFEDVRALGFLRPPWGLAYDQVIDGVWRRFDAG